MGLDVGRVVIGLAISDPHLKVASPLAGLPRKGFTPALVKLIQERNVGGLVVGLPKNMDGTEGKSSQSVRGFVYNLVWQGMRLPVAFWDERLSTAAIERAMIAGDLSRQKRLAHVDKAAAAYILQGALDSFRIQT